VFGRRDHEGKRIVMDPKVVLFERVIWVNAVLRYFKNEPTDAVLESLGVQRAALVEGRAQLHAAYVESMARGDLELSNRQAAEVGRATLELALKKPTLDDVRRLRAACPRDDWPIPDVVQILTARLEHR